MACAPAPQRLTEPGFREGLAEPVAAREEVTVPFHARGPGLFRLRYAVCAGCYRPARWGRFGPGGACAWQQTAELRADLEASTPDLEILSGR